jgi:transcriptional regulator with XRE-family HTH domain
MDNNCILTKLGQRIRTLRTSRGLSQERFALLIEMDRTYFASVEAGKRNISLKNLEKIAKGFDLSLSQLFEKI